MKTVLVLLALFVAADVQAAPMAPQPTSIVCVDDALTAICPALTRQAIRRIVRAFRAQYPELEGRCLKRAVRKLRRRLRNNPPCSWSETAALMDRIAKRFINRCGS